MADRQTMKDQIASQMGVTFTSKEQNRNLTAAQCGQVGGEMVKQALRQAGFTNK